MNIKLKELKALIKEEVIKALEEGSDEEVFIPHGREYMPVRSYNEIVTDSDLLSFIFQLRKEYRDRIEQAMLKDKVGMEPMIYMLEKEPKLAAHLEQWTRDKLGGFFRHHRETILDLLNRAKEVKDNL